METVRFRLWVFLALVLLGGGALALAWWDWTFPGRLLAWWNGERVYPFFWRQLGWMLAACEGLCLSLWLIGARVRRQGRVGLARAARPFALGFLALGIYARYAVHPLGVQVGSAVWTWGLAAVTAAVVAFSLSGLVRRVGGDDAWERRGWRVVCVAAVLYLGVFGALSVARHASFRSHALDLGTMDQAAWNTIHGRVLERSPLYRAPADGSRYENRLLDAKLELLFIPLSALYWLWPDPRVLLVVQTAFLAAAALPLYRLIASQGQPLLAVLIALGYLAYMPLHYVNIADFHMSALMVPFLVAAWWAVRQRRWRAYYAWLALAFGCRIDAAFVGLALGVSIAIWQRGYRRHGLYTVAFAAAWLALDFGIVVPVVRHAYGPGAGDLVARRFQDLGGSASGVVRTLLTNPGLAVSRLADREKIQTLFDLMAPLGFLPVLGLPALLPALPVLGINLLASSTWQNSVHAHYMAPVIPFLWIALGEGLIWLGRRGRRGLVFALGCYAAISTLLSSYLFSPFPPGKAFHIADFVQSSPYEENLRAITAQVPADASVCAQSDVYPHLSQRRDALLFPHCRLQGDLEAEYIVLDLDASATKSPLGFHTFYELVDVWLTRPDYGVVDRQGGVLLLRRAALRQDLPAVLAGLDTYGRSFYRVAYKEARLPPTLRARDMYRVRITLQNTGSQCWQSRDQLPVRLAYRWWTAEGALLAVDPLRTNLPHRVEPGETVRLWAWLRTPPHPGEYALEWDLLREGDAWFGDMGAAMLRQQVRVR